MSDETKSVESNEEIKNLKAEFNRKLDNQNTQLQSILEALNKQSAPAPKLESKKVSVFEDEDAYASRIKHEAVQEAKREIAQQNAVVTKHQTVVAKIMNDYPEVQDNESALMRRSREIFASYDSDEQASPIAMKTAVAEAASELGIKPRAKRPVTDEYVASSSGSGSSGRKKDPEVSNQTLEFARIMGLDVSDKNVRNRLKG